MAAVPTSVQLFPPLLGMNTLDWSTVSSPDVSPSVNASVTVDLQEGWVRRKSATLASEQSPHTVLLWPLTWSYDRNMYFLTTFQQANPSLKSVRGYPTSALGK